MIFLHAKRPLVSLAWSGALNTTGTKPAVRAYHTAVIYGNYMYIFGGYANGSYQDTHRLNLDTLAWSDTLTTSGTKPTARDSHTAGIYGNYMYIFGGTTASAQQDTHRLNLDTLEWSDTLTTSGTKPTARYMHTAGIYSNYMYIFGGSGATASCQDTHRLNLDTLAWSGELTTSGTKPAARYSHTAVVYNKSMYIFGGFTTSNQQDTHKLEGLQ